MFENLLRVKSIVDSLAVVGSLVPVNDYIEAIFDGLPDEYELVITTVLSKMESYTVDEIEALLLDQETRLEKKSHIQVLESSNSKTEVNSTTEANLAQTKNVDRYPNGDFQNNRGRGYRFPNNRGGRRGGRQFF